MKERFDVDKDGDVDMQDARAAGIGVMEWAKANKLKAGLIIGAVVLVIVLAAVGGDAVDVGTATGFLDQ